MMRALSMLIVLGLCLPGCDRGGGVLAERVEGFCTQVTARFTSWASAPAQMTTPIDAGSLSREVTFCLRVREGDAEPLVQQVSEHLDALVTGQPADARIHLDAILAMLNEASRRPLVR
jgi:hypothetical protein